MSLTRAEKSAGKAFRAAARLLLAAREELSPAAAHCPPYTVWFRHDCAGRGSWALFLRQHCLESPRYFPGLPDEVPAGTFAYLWREGTCPHCGLSARSGDGILQVTRGDSLPERGAVAHAADELSAFHQHQGGPAGAPGLV